VRARVSWNMLKRLLLPMLVTALCLPAQELTPNARRQIAALLAERRPESGASQKDSHLFMPAPYCATGGSPDFAAPPGELEAVRLDARNQVEVDIGADVTAGLLAQIGALGGTVATHFRVPVRASHPATAALEQLAGRPEVRQIRTADEGHSNLGPDTSGDIAHMADRVRADLGLDGAGVKVGVLSDGVNSLVAEQAAEGSPPTSRCSPARPLLGTKAPRCSRLSIASPGRVPLLCHCHRRPGGHGQQHPGVG